MSSSQYYIIGDPVEHSLSPRVYAAIFEKYGMKAHSYDRRKITLETLYSEVAALKREKVAGMSVTMPLKQAIVPLLDSVHQDAAKIGAVNTVKSEKGKLVGYNTDWYGISNPLTNSPVQTAVIFGAGGAARAAIFALQNAGVQQIYCSNRSTEKSEALALEFGIHAGTPDRTDLLFNATSVGMGKLTGKSPVPDHLITRNTIVFDAIYEPQETKLVRDAKSAGATCITGVEMFAAQAQAQIKILLGIDEEIADIQKAIL